MSSDSALDRLAAMLGIEAEFRDARGRMVNTSAETKRHLVTAMGIRLTTPSDAEAALEQLEYQEWQQPLPPVHVVLADQPIRIGVALPRNTKTVDWLIACEDGTQQSGHSPFHVLDLMEEKEIGGERLERRRLELRCNLPCGYHSLQIQ